MNRYSSRRHKLDKQFLCEKMKNAASYDRIAGYFCSSILEVAGENIENIEGKVRVICNSNLLPEDVEVANYVQKMKQEWCAFSPEEKYTSPDSSKRLSILFHLLSSGKLEVRVIPDQIFGLMHGKAGVITYKDGSKTSFLGSINETKSAFTLNYEMLWEDDSEESVKWVQEEFDFFWNSQYAVNLCDFVINDINRISKRMVIGLKDWRENADEVVPSVAVEEPVYRKEFGLWEHQKYFVELAFKEHKKDGGARFLLADQVGLGKTLQLAMSAKLMALYGEKPVLIIVPKTLVWQWQDEMKTLLDMPSAVWTGTGWQDENGYFYQADSARAILKCPRKVGIISQGLVSRRTEAAELLAQKEFECVILDEAHRARRRNPAKDPNKYKADPNYLLQFIDTITFKTKSLLLATATPVQINPIEAFDLINALSLPTWKVMGDIYSEWHKKPQLMLDMVCGKEPYPDSEIKMWDIIRNPFPAKTNSAQDRVNRIRDRLDISDKTYVLPADYYASLSSSKKESLKPLYATDAFVANYNPYIRHIVRRTRDFLENTTNPASGETYLKKIEVELYGEGDDGAIPLEGYLRQAYSKAQDFCSLLSSRVKAGGFMSTLILKRIGSTIIAGDNTAKKMLAWTEAGKEILQDEFDVVFEEDDDYEETISEVKNLTDAETECLRQLVKMLSLNHDNDPKYIKVLDILNKGTDKNDLPWKNSGCIIFSQYYDSAYFVAERLSKDLTDNVIGLYAGGDKSGFFLNGIYKKDSKDNIKAKVKDYEIKILVGTDAASEGLNLQTLSTLINLDLPWNPTRLEQRKGRIQRIGQVSPKVKIFNMRYKDSVEDKVHTVLSSRLKNIKDMFGQIPDTLEDVWIDVALNKIEEAKERIDRIPEQNPFTIKYETKIPATEDWEACTFVLDHDEKLKQLLNGW
ncbi:MAG: DEAD/DEAH box helicase family protein [Acholeplasmataceae bacterium]|nr:DEAD/DEAH box helicase family protein [Acholeplasmataceae bacterium]